MTANKQAGKNGAPRKNPTSVRVVWALAALLALGAGGLAYQQNLDAPTEPHPVRGGDTSPIMDPRNFSGSAYGAYLAASLYPEALDQVYCHCQCDRPPFFHKSLRQCFSTSHGAG